MSASAECRRAIGATWLGRGIVAGLFAVIANSLILVLADSTGLVTARGGLLTLILHVSGVTLEQLRAMISRYAMIEISQYSVQSVFHIAIGVVMGITYAYLFRRDSGKNLTVVKGVFCAGMVWQANACVILPLIDQGFAGSKVLSVAGMIYFAFAHTVFFVLLAILDARFKRASSPIREGCPA